MWHKGRASLRLLYSLSPKTLRIFLCPSFFAFLSPLFLVCTCRCFSSSLPSTEVYFRSTAELRAATPLFFLLRPSRHVPYSSKNAHIFPGFNMTPRQRAAGLPASSLYLSKETTRQRL